MPHLCDKMRRLTTKDLSKKKKMEDGPTPDFYALSRDKPLPESTPVPTTTLTPPALAGGRTGTDMTNADMELALLERRRADIFNRMNLFAGSNGMNPNSFGAAPGHQMPSQQDMNNNSLVAAAALSLGNNGRPNTMNSAGAAGLQQQMLGGMPNVGQFFDNSNSALQRQLLEARLANSDMATILGLNGGSMQSNGGINGIPGLLMPPNL